MSYQMSCIWLHKNKTYGCIKIIHATGQVITISRATVTNYHRPHGLKKKQKYVLSQFWRLEIPKSKIKMMTGLVPSGKFLRRICPRPLSELLVVTSNPRCSLACGGITPADPPSSLFFCIQISFFSLMSHHGTTEVIRRS